MNIVLPVATAQTLTFIPRESAASVVVKITNEETEVETPATLAATYTDGYMSVSVTYSFVERGSYSYQVETVAGDLLYRGKIFATAQSDLENYNSNNDLLTA